MSAEVGKWLKISLTSKQMADGLVGQIQDECFAFFAGAGVPEAAKLLSRTPAPGQRKDVFRELYLSPAMAHLCRTVVAKHFAVTTTAPPAKCTATLISSRPPQRQTTPERG